MSLLDDLKAKADANGDGKISKEDIEALKKGNDDSMLDKLKDLADQNDDGKINFEDVKKFDLGDTISDLKDTFFK